MKSTTFNLGEAISLGFDIFKKDIGNIVIGGLLFTIISFVSLLIPMVGFISVFLFIPVFMAGYMTIIHKTALNQRVSMKDLFSRFDKMGQLFVYIILDIILMSLAYLPIIMGTDIIEVYASIIEQGDAVDLEVVNQQVYDTLYSNPLPMIVSYLLFFLLGGMTMMMPYFFCLGNTSFTDAFKFSMLIFFKNIHKYFVLIILFYILNFVGVALLVIGLLFSTPLSLCTIYATFYLTADISENDDRDHEDFLDTASILND